jgi:hypothetical protein
VMPFPLDPSGHLPGIFTPSPLLLYSMKFH